MIKMELLQDNRIDNKEIEKNLFHITPEKQNIFIETTLGKTINTGLDIGLRLLLPDFIENQVIEVKDALLSNGLKAGIDKAIQSAIDFRKK